MGVPKPRGLVTRLLLERKYQESRVMETRSIQGVLGSIPDGVAVDVKVVPGASRTQIAGLMGQRLKIRVSAPPEGGKANRAVCELLAEVFGVPPRNVVVAAGQTTPQKTIHVIGVSLCQASERIQELIAD